MRMPGGARQGSGGGAGRGLVAHGSLMNGLLQPNSPITDASAAAARIGDIDDSSIDFQEVRQRFNAGPPPAELQAQHSIGAAGSTERHETEGVSNGSPATPQSRCVQTRLPAQAQPTSQPDDSATPLACTGPSSNHENSKNDSSSSSNGSSLSDAFTQAKSEASAAGDGPSSTLPHSQLQGTQISTAEGISSQLVPNKVTRDAQAATTGSNEQAAAQAQAKCSCRVETTAKCCTHKQEAENLQSKLQATLRRHLQELPTTAATARGREAGRAAAAAALHREQHFIDLRRTSAIIRRRVEDRAAAHARIQQEREDARVRRVERFERAANSAAQRHLQEQHDATCVQLNHTIFSKDADVVFAQAEASAAQKNYIEQQQQFFAERAQYEEQHAADNARFQELQGQHAAVNVQVAGLHGQVVDLQEQITELQEQLSEAQKQLEQLPSAEARTVFYSKQVSVVRAKSLRRFQLHAQDRADLESMRTETLEQGEELNRLRVQSKVDRNRVERLEAEAEQAMSILTDKEPHMTKKGRKIAGWGVGVAALVCVLVLALVGCDVVPLTTCSPCLAPYSASNVSTYMVFANGSSSSMPHSHSNSTWMAPSADTPSSAGTAAGPEPKTASAQARTAGAMITGVDVTSGLQDVGVNFSTPAAAAAAQARSSPAFVPLLPQCLPVGSSSNTAAAVGMKCSCSNGTTHSQYAVKSHLGPHLDPEEVQQTLDQWQQQEEEDTVTIVDQQQGVFAAAEGDASGEQQRPVCSVAKRHFAGLTSLVMVIAALAFCMWLGVDGPMDLQGAAFCGLLIVGYMGPDAFAMQALKVVCPLA